jgi:hypothetical protein
MTAAARAPARFAPMTRCTPSAKGCHQRCNCARALQPADGGKLNGALVVDASVLLHSAGAWCPMFIDARGIALKEA